MPGSPVLHYLLEFAQIHVHWVSDIHWIGPGLNLRCAISLLWWIAGPIWQDNLQGRLSHGQAPHLSQGSVAVSHKAHSSFLWPCSRFSGAYIVILLLLFAISFTLCLSRPWYHYTTGSVQLFVPRGRAACIESWISTSWDLAASISPKAGAVFLGVECDISRSKEANQALCFPSVLGDTGCSNLPLIFKVITE